MVSTYGPLLSVPDDLSIPQFMTKYNPDNVSRDKVVHTDTISGKTLTYGGLRVDAAKCAWGLRHKLGLREGDIISLLCPNSVRGPESARVIVCWVRADNSLSPTLFSYVMRHGGQVESCRTRPLLSCPPMTDHTNVYSPLNTSSTAKDLAQAFDVSRPTHIAVYPAFLKTVQDALRETDLAKEGNSPIIVTLLQRVNGLPMVITL